MIGPESDIDRGQAQPACAETAPRPPPATSKARSGRRQSLCRPCPLRRRVTVCALSFKLLLTSLRAASHAGASPKIKPVENCDGRRKSKYTPVHGHIDLRLLPTVRHQLGNGIASQVPEQQPARAADRRQQQALGQQLAQDTRPPRSQRQPHAHLPLPLRAARQQQVGNVGAGQQQHKTGHRHQHIQAVSRTCSRRSSTPVRHRPLRAEESSRQASTFIVARVAAASSTFSAACACASVTPGFARPMMFTHHSRIVQKRTGLALGIDHRLHADRHKQIGRSHAHFSRP